ncbi:MAG TPA: YceI family protein [Rhodocyclaceae bacterium]|nr:YceI family protein [Rhodocyclaceae bacterium]
MKTRIISIALASLVSGAALAAPATYVVDSTHTFPRFSYSHLGLSTQLSRFNQTTGTITLDREAKTGSVEVEIDMTSVDTGYGTFNEHIQGADFLDTANHPKATFKSTKVTFEGDAPVTIEGDLTIKGVTKPVTLKVTHFVAKPHPMLQKDAIGANASALISRSAFNAGKYAPNVGDEVSLDISLEAIRQ